MPTQLFRARQERADGTPILEIATPYLLGHDQAAMLLAAVTRDRPMARRIHSVVDHLQLAVRSGLADVDELVTPVPERAVQAYRARLTELNVFPDPETRAAMLAELDRAKTASKSAGDRYQAEVRKVTGKQPRVWSKHDDPETGEPAIRIEVQHYYDLDQAAWALALAHPAPEDRADLVPRYTHTLRQMLQRVAREKLLENGETPAAGLVDAYRALLLEQGVYPEPEPVGPVRSRIRKT